MEAINESLHPPMDNRVREACQYISDHLADSNFDIASVAQHVCLSPSRLSHLFRQQLGISVLSWREDQRISQAKLLLSTTRMPIATVGRNVGFDDQRSQDRKSTRLNSSHSSPSRMPSSA